MCSYKGEDMQKAHAHLKLSNKEFDAIVELLVATLTEIGVSKDLIAEIGTFIEQLRIQIVNGGNN
jgi:truncated hemoglobin YjbI